MDSLEVVRALAGYNAWINARLYDAAERLPEAERYAGRGAFFGSIAGTLNHLVVGDALWLRRFAAADEAGALRAADSWLPRPATLDETLFTAWAPLRAMRERIDGLILAWCDELRPASLDAVLEYCNMRGEPQRRPLGLLLAHFFNHGTHHRGQVSTLLMQAGVDPGVTDLVAFLPQAPC